MSTRLVVVDYYNKVKNKKLTLDLRPVKLQLFQSPRGVMVAITFLDTNTTIYMTPSEFLRRNYINRIQVANETKQDDGE
ncbi:hypothetical protein [Thermofilum sp.]|uniref:hypothetical protein n=1 Tax=Thermofilum sp. TaxID=1961369 RepID=UPI00316F6717